MMGVGTLATTERASLCAQRGRLASWTAAVALALTPMAGVAATPNVERTPITGLAGKPLTRAVLEAYMPQLLASPRYNEFMWLSLRELQKFDPVNIKDSLLTAVDAALGQSVAPPTVSSTPILLLAARPETRGVLESSLPGVLNHPEYPRFRYLSLKGLQTFDPRLSDPLLDKIQIELDGVAERGKRRR